jgi:LPS export ABC transporter protein LptC
MVSSAKIRFLLAILVTTAIVGIVAAISLKGSRRPPMDPVHLQLPQNIDVAMHNARFAEIRNGITVWELIAGRAEYDKSGDVVYLSNIRMEFAKTRSTGAITVTAAKGEYSSKSNDVKLRGKVHVTTETHASFDTESIDYLATKSQFQTSESVAFRHQRLALSAQGMELNVKDQKARFYKDINATLAAMLKPT